MADYDAFSKCYDRFTEDVDYPARTKRILELFEKYDRLSWKNLQDKNLYISLQCTTTLIH